MSYINYEFMKTLVILRNFRDDYPTKLIEKMNKDDVKTIAISDAVLIGDKNLIKLKDDLEARGLSNSDKDISVSELVDMIFESDKVITF